MLNIVYGLPGSPKSSHIYSLALKNLQAGGTSILVVPEQESVSAERKIYNMSGDVPLLGLEVLNFDKLAETVFRKCGFLSYKYITDSTKKLLLSRLLSDISPALSEFSSRHDDSNFISTMLSQINEFKYAKITPETLAQTSKLIKINSGKYSDKLIERINELALIFASYNSTVNEMSSDPCDNLSKCAELILNNDPFNGACFYFDSFNGYTAQEFDIISALLHSRASVTVTLTHPGTDNADELFEFTDITRNRLKACAQKENCEISETILDKNTYYKSDSISHIANHFTTSCEAEKYNGKPDVQIISCSDIFDECETCASLIANDIRSGRRYRDIAIIFRNPDNYKGFIDEALERYSIPCFFSDKTDILEKSLTRFIFAALEICNNGAKYTDIITYLRCGLTCLSEYETDILENYVSTWKVSGKIWYSDDGFTMNPRGYMPLTASDAEALDNINALRKRVMNGIESLRQKLKESKTVTDYATCIFEFVSESDVCEKLAARARLMEEQNETVLALEEAGLLSALSSALDELVSSIGDHECCLEEFIKLLRMILSDTEIGTIPQSADIVTIGDASLLRLHDIENVYMLGCNEGQFPKSISAPGILSAEERKILFENNLDDILFDPANESLKELFYFYLSATSPASKLTLMHIRRNFSGEDLFESSALTRVSNMFDGAVIDSSDIDALNRIVNTDSFIEHIPYLKEKTDISVLEEFIESDPRLKAECDASENLLPVTDEHISKKAVDYAFPGDISITQSATDLYAKCPFSFQCKYALKLKEKPTDSIEFSDLGTLIHSILDDFLKEEVNQEKENICLDREIIYEKIKNITDKRSKILLEFTAVEKRARVARMLERVADITALTAANLAEEFAQSGFTPSFFEFPISTSSSQGLLPIKLKLEDNSYILLGGIADRVDTMVKSGKLYIRVADYKTGARSFSLDSIRMGLNLQLLIYLFSIWENTDVGFKTTVGAAPDAEVIPAAAEYVMTTPNFTRVDADSEDFEKKLEKIFKRSGIYIADPEIIDDMDRSTSGRYVPIKSNNTPLSGSELATLDEFNDLKNEVSGILTEIGNGIKSGNAAISPIEKIPGTDYSACTYCPMKPVCKNAAYNNATYVNEENDTNNY